MAFVVVFSLQSITTGLGAGEDSGAAHAAGVKRQDTAGASPVAANMVFRYAQSFEVASYEKYHTCHLNMRSLGYKTHK